MTGMCATFFIGLVLCAVVATTAHSEDNWAEDSMQGKWGDDHDDYDGHDAGEAAAPEGDSHAEDAEGDEGDDEDGDAGPSDDHDEGSTLPTPPSPSKDPTCKGSWCQSPEGPPQQCTEDTGPPWADDGFEYPNKHYWSDTPATPILPSNGKCPPPLQAACARKGTKAAHLDGPVQCGGKGFFCRIVPQKNWLNPSAEHMKGDPKHDKGMFRESNFYHCNRKIAHPKEMEGWADGHCHGGLTDDSYGWWLRDHWFRGYAGTLHCCCDYGAVKGVVNSCDIRRHVSEADSKSGKCTDPNEDTRAEHMHTSGCSDADIANFKDPKDSAKPGQETCWTVKNFADPTQVLGHHVAATSLVQPITATGSVDDWSESTT